MDRPGPITFTATFAAKFTTLEPITEFIPTNHQVYGKIGVDIILSDNYMYVPILGKYYPRSVIDNNVMLKQSLYPRDANIWSNGQASIFDELDPEVMESAIELDVTKL